MLVKILFSAFLLGMMLSASSYGYDVPIYTDPRCAGLGVEGHKVAECSFYLEKRTKAKLRKTYLKALAYTAEKKHLRKSQRLWEQFAQYECSQDNGNTSSYVPVYFAFCYVRKMEQRDQEIRRMYPYAF